MLGIGLEVDGGVSNLYGGGAALGWIPSPYSPHTGIGACVLSGRLISSAFKAVVCAYKIWRLLSLYIKASTEAPDDSPSTRMHGLCQKQPFVEDDDHDDLLPGST